MAKLTPEQEARYALDYGLRREDLPQAAQAEYDLLKPDWEAAQARARAETRARIEAVQADYDRLRDHWLRQRAGARAHEPSPMPDEGGPMARPASHVPSVNADEVRDVRFRRGSYDAAEVDDLHSRLGTELDAGRPAGPLIANAAFRSKGLLGRGYAVESVDWFLDQLRSREDYCDLAGTGADPWRDLAVANYFTRSGPGLDQECMDAWRGFGQVPGTQLRWVWAGATRRELRTAEQHPIASSRYGWSPTLFLTSWAPDATGTTFSTGERTFAAKRITRSSRPDVAEMIRRSHRIGGHGHFLAAGTPQALERNLGLAYGPDNLREFRDETGTPVLYTSGIHGNHGAGGCITFPDRRRLRFPVRSTSRGNAVMTAVDQGGNKVARYRVIGSLRTATVEITVHPDEKLTDELTLALLISAPWLPYDFVDNGGGG